jgi:hypothetical protein
MSAEGSSSEEKNSLSGQVRDEKHRDHPSVPAAQVHVDDVISNVNAKLANPLTGLSHEQLMHDGAEFARAHGLGHLEELFSKGALAAQDPFGFESNPHFTEAEKDIFRREMTHRWDHPATLYYLAILCSVAAAVQGVSGSCSTVRFLVVSLLILSNQMDETVINGANLFYAPQFGIDPNQGNKSQNQWLLGLVNAAPYVCVAITSLKRPH